MRYYSGCQSRANIRCVQSDSDLRVFVDAARINDLELLFPCGKAHHLITLHRTEIAVGVGRRTDISDNVVVIAQLVDCPLAADNACQCLLNPHASEWKDLVVIRIIA